MSGLVAHPASRMAAPQCQQRSCAARWSCGVVVRAQLQRPQQRPGCGGGEAPAPASTTRRELLGMSMALPGLAALAAALPTAALLAAPGRAHAAGPSFPSPAVQSAVDKALARYITKGKAAVALRLVFHDAGTFSAASKDGGLNGSIQYELDRPENMGLKRGWRLIEQVRDDLKGTPAEGVVSEADIVALAGAWAVRVCGGPVISLPIGRPTAAAAMADPAGRMPSERSSAEQLKANFAAKGFSVREMIVLSGAHTVGSKGFGDPVTFDNEYFVQLLRKPWLNAKDGMGDMIGLPSDHVLPDDPECLPYIQRYAEDQGAFFAEFAAAYVKMAGLGVAGWA